MGSGDLKYLAGFGNFFETEAERGALPVGMNNPQRAAHGLYAEQLSGSSFVAPRGDNQRSWLYRIMPSVAKGSSPELHNKPSTWNSSPAKTGVGTPEQLRWDPLPFPKSERKTFVESLYTVCGNGSVADQTGSAVHLYACNASMERECVVDADGDLLIVPQQGRLLFWTECGRLEVEPHEIIVIPRGIRFKVVLLDKDARGYVCENFGAHLAPPHRGPIGANGLANERDFLAPTAAYEDREEQWQVTMRYLGESWRTVQPHSPFDVVAWHGNYYPYKYDLRRFNTINTVSFDHPDPSIFTVLTSPSGRPGTANVDFVIFPPRWMVAENTFRPPYYHRNVMSEYMGLIHGVYDAKSPTAAGGFVPGGGSLHNCMSAHGPDRETFDQASSAELEPRFHGDTLAFMFETAWPYVVSRQAYDSPIRQRDYLDCWNGLERHFKKPK